MANMPHDRETPVEQDPAERLTRLVAAMAGSLIRAGLLPWSTHSGRPVTTRGQQETDAEEYLRHG